VQRSNHRWMMLSLVSAAVAALSCGGGGGSSGYRIQLQFETALTDAQKKAFEDAASRIEAFVTSGLSEVKFTSGQTCGAGGTDYPVPATVKNLLIFVEVTYIDGVGGVLAASGPCFKRTSNGLPVVGIMRFDSTDLDALEADGTLKNVVLHEMLHVVGFGTIWGSKNLLSTSISDPEFLGAGASDAFQHYNGGTTDTVPVEAGGGEGTAFSHWRESVFKNELMTGYMSGTTQPLSRTSLASLADLGYQVALSKADAFTLAEASNLRRLASGATDEPVRFLGQDTLSRPAEFVDDTASP
jgi:hypothetical protein